MKLNKFVSLSYPNYEQWNPPLRTLASTGAKAKLSSSFLMSVVWSAWGGGSSGCGGSGSGGSGCSECMEGVGVGAVGGGSVEDGREPSELLIKNTKIFYPLFCWM